jgi:hypothetical protein
VTPRATDWGLVLLVGLLSATGVMTLFAGGRGDAWVFAAHGAGGFGLAAVLGWKLRRVWRRLLQPARWDRRTAAGAGALGLVAATLLSGVGWSSGFELSTEFSTPAEESWDHTFATIRRYESIDQRRTDELVKKADESLLPKLSELPGFNGYYLIRAGDGVMSSVGIFDTLAHADESTRVASAWVRENKLETALPTPPKVTTGEIVVNKTRELVQA